MVAEENRKPMLRRDLIALIGAVGGAATMYQAMTALGFAAESDYKGPFKLDGDPKGASVLILGAGLAGLVAAYELGKAGYRVQVLEYENRAGGRCWTLRGGDRFTEIGGAEQRCEFDRGLYFNTGPWRIPYHHRALLDYCKRFGVALEPFVHVNHNAYVHAKDAMGGKPQRYRHVKADFHGHVAELLAKTINQNQLDARVTREDQEKLLEHLRVWGALDRNYAYVKGEISSDRRGFDKDQGAGLPGEPEPSQPLQLSDVLNMGLWSQFGSRHEYDYQSPLLQPVGGMDAIVRGFLREVASVVRLNSKVISIRQDGNGVTVSYEDTRRAGTQTARADWCLCTIPLTVLSKIEMNVGPPMRSAISAVGYSSSLKVGLQFKRRFWEEDEAIYGGISFTDLAVRQISYPSNDYHSANGIVLGAYPGGTYAREFAALEPQARVRRAVELGAAIHPQYEREFENGISVAWDRIASAQGGFATWPDGVRAQHYANLCSFDGRIALAGEHASYLSAWQEGAVLSALDTVGRLHRRVLAG